MLGSNNKQYACFGNFIPHAAIIITQIFIESTASTDPSVSSVSMDVHVRMHSLIGKIQNVYIFLH